MVSDDSNNPLTQAGSGIQIRQDSRFTLAYQYSDNLTISLPVHILNFEYGGEYDAVRRSSTSSPGIDINVAKTGAISNLNIKFGEIDNMPSSLTGSPSAPRSAIAVRSRTSSRSSPIRRAWR